MKEFDAINVLGLIILITGFATILEALHLFELHTSGFWGFVQAFNPGNYLSIIPPITVGIFMTIAGIFLLTHDPDAGTSYPQERQI